MSLKAEHAAIDLGGRVPSGIRLSGHPPPPRGLSTNLMTHALPHTPRRTMAWASEPEERNGPQVSVRRRLRPRIELLRTTA